MQQVAHKIDVLNRHCADAVLSTAEQLAPLGVGLINVGPLPGNPDPVGFVRRLGDELIARLSQVA